MPEARVGVTKKDAQKLRYLTGTEDLQEAVEKAIQFALRHDKDSVQEALNS